MDKQKFNNFFDYSLEPRRAILFEDVKSNYASIECVQRNLNPLTTSLCVMSRADNTKELTLASSRGPEHMTPICIAKKFFIETTFCTIV